jgi:anthranilate synthase component 2
LKILIVDNYDSFTYNLVHLVEQFDGAAIFVRRNDEITLEEVNDFDKIILSPGPGLPKDAGIMEELIMTYADKKSILGVCLGHQAIAECFGGKLINLNRPSHGVAVETIVIDDEERIFNNLPKHFDTGRYHSWAVASESLPSSIKITATDNSGTIMALSHKDFDLKGIQFHPESILSQYGKELISNWLNI